MATPKAAAVWLSSSSEAAGLRRKTKTTVWLKMAPLRGERRRKNRVVRDAASATMVNISRMAWATWGSVVIGEAPLKGILLCVVTT